MTAALELARRFAPWLAAAALILLAVLVAPSGCDRARRLAVEQRVERVQREAQTASARDAIAASEQAARREQHSESITATNEKDIRNAPGASLPVDPLATGAGLDSLCRRAAYRDSQRCRLRRPASP